MPQDTVGWPTQSSGLPLGLPRMRTKLVSVGCGWTAFLFFIRAHGLILAQRDPRPEKGIRNPPPGARQIHTHPFAGSTTRLSSTSASLARPKAQHLVAENLCWTTK